MNQRIIIDRLATLRVPPYVCELFLKALNTSVRFIVACIGVFKICEEN